MAGDPEISMDVGVRGYGLLEGQGQFYNFARVERVIAVVAGRGNTCAGTPEAISSAVIVTLRISSDMVRWPPSPSRSR
ncbi:hypothetical protein ACK11Z_02490 [Methanoculleus bourgensis]|uniref:hypothetical protein n=1 Tax=Methanoculleus bourgensis TaxID=83986 RepID=UPI003B93A942